MLPVSAESGRPTSLLIALFTATGAMSGALVIVDTSTHFSIVGEVVVMLLIQAGGLGIMTLASLLGLLVVRRFRLRMQLTAQAETKALGLGDVRRLLGRIVLLSAFFELIVAVALSIRLVVGYQRSVGRAVYEGVFHSISAFNNAGISLYPRNLIDFATDPWISLPIAFASIAGGLGFPVLLELGRRFRKPGRWTLHTKITVWGSGLLFVVGAAVITAAEWNNPGTLGPFSAPGKVLAGFFAGVTPRTAGFNNVDIASMYPATLLVQDVLMFIGGGSAGTAGGIKVTTFALLAFVLYAEIRGEPTVHVMGRRLSGGVQRQALTVALVGVALVVGCTLILLAISPFDLDQVLFEVISAFGSVGLTTGITAALPPLGQVVLIVLMLVGRVGPITLGTALALRERVRRYELPEERPIVG
ncbi:TrkH family potassium uptake protein [Saccharopolyspora sp. K220]|nr:potassium transporter TrkG [Saccharopolyspora soli]MCI2418547.1 TrkH family potassium uptake protein [Saccharopolyspora soli]